MVNNIQLYDTLRQNLGEQGAKAIVDFVDSKLKESNEDNLKSLATQEDFKDLKLVVKQDISDLRVEVNQEIFDLRAEVKQDISDLRTEVKQDISDLRAEVKQDISDLRVEFKQDISDLRVEFKQDFNKLSDKIGDSKVQTITWVVGLFITLILTIIFRK